MFFFKKNEFMGRCYIKPSINIDNSKPPKLKWHKLYFSNKPAGDVLSSFELVLVIKKNI